MLELKNIHFKVNPSGWSQRSKNLLYDINLSVYKNEIFGLAGKNGAGKSTLAKIICQLSKPSSGQIFFHNKNITNCRGRNLKNLRKELQIVFQNPQSNLHPRMTILKLMAEPLLIHKLYSRTTITDKITSMISRAGLRKTVLNRYPDELSGGEIQRVAIARILLLNPSLIVLDEPTSMLDPSVQAQIFTLLLDYHRQAKATFILISHDFKLLKKVCTRIAIIECGQISIPIDAKTFAIN